MAAARRRASRRQVLDGDGDPSAVGGAVGELADERQLSGGRGAGVRVVLAGHRDVHLPLVCPCRRSRVATAVAGGADRRCKPSRVISGRTSASQLRGLGCLNEIAFSRAARYAIATSRSYHPAGVGVGSGSALSDGTGALGGTAVPGELVAGGAAGSRRAAGCGGGPRTSPMPGWVVAYLWLHNKAVFTPAVFPPPVFPLLCSPLPPSTPSSRAPTLPLPGSSAESRVPQPPLPAPPSSSSPGCPSGPVAGRATVSTRSISPRLRGQVQRGVRLQVAVVMVLSWSCDGPAPLSCCPADRRRNGSSATRATCCASSRPTWPPTRFCRTSALSALPGCSG